MYSHKNIINTLKWFPMKQMWMDCGNNRKLMHQCITEKGRDYIKKIIYNKQLKIFNNLLYLRSSQNIVYKYIKFINPSIHKVIMYIGYSYKYQINIFLAYKSLQSSGGHRHIQERIMDWMSNRSASKVIMQERNREINSQLLIWKAYGGDVIWAVPSRQDNIHRKKMRMGIMLDIVKYVLGWRVFLPDWRRD